MEIKQKSSWVSVMDFDKKIEVDHNPHYWLLGGLIFFPHFGDKFCQNCTLTEGLKN